MLTVTRRLVVVALIACFGAIAAAQNRAPNADDVKSIQAKYDAERTAAAEQKFPTKSFDLSEQLAKRAQAARDGNALREASRLYREARCSFPIFLPICRQA